MDPDLYAKAKKKAMRKFKIWPSAYASGYLIKEYKRMGGRYKNNYKNFSSGIRRWFDEKWIDVCSLPKIKPCGRTRTTWRNFPYCRPSVRVNSKTPVTVHELTPKQILGNCKRKKRAPSKRVNVKTRKSKRRSRSRSKPRKSKSTTRNVKLSRSTNPNKKWMVHIPHKNCTVHFGGSGYSDYTKHHSEKRKRLYLARHRARENWTSSGMCTAGFWSRHLLWNKPSIKQSKQDMQAKFRIKFS